MRTTTEFFITYRNATSSPFELLWMSTIYLNNNNNRKKTSRFNTEA